MTSRAALATPAAKNHFLTNEVLLQNKIDFYSKNDFHTLKINTLMCLIEGQALIKWQGGIFSKFNKRAGSNKEAGWNIFSNLIRGQERFVPYKRAGWKFNK